LKNADTLTDSVELEQLANAVAAISKLETTDDILDSSDAKLAELLAFANAKITEIGEFCAAKQEELQEAKDNDLTEIVEFKQEGLTAVQEQLDDGKGELNSVVDDFATMNDVPENSTVCILLYTSSYFIASSTSYYYHSQFINWRLDSVRSGFLVDGLEIDLERTLKAWQCPGYQGIYNIWRQEQYE
jgi:hypothetical protein